ncbi:MAG: hypothetical protein ACLVE7_10010 [Coprococcus comes]
MAFLKVRNVKGKEDTIINTDLICRIAKSKNGYTVFFQAVIRVLPIMSMMKKMQKEFLMLLAYPYNSMIYG